MTTSLARADARDRAAAQPSLSRYRPELQAAVRALAGRHIRLAELSVSFPALFVALARPRKGFDPEPMIAGAIAGAPLAALAEAAGVPLWLRKARPEIFSAPVPALPDTLYLRRRIVNHLPRHHKAARGWFEAVTMAARLAHDPFALWCARQCAQKPGSVKMERFKLLCLWAWFSTQPGGRARDLIERPWSEDMELKSAVDSARAWFNAMSLEVELGDRAVEDMWLRPGNVNGFDFRPLATARDIADEAKAMRNCVRTYGWRIATDQRRLWSVQRRGRRVATLCVGWRGHDPLPVIWDIELSRNRNASELIWLAARKWLIGQDLTHLVWGKMQRREGGYDAEVWISLWRPYWIAKRTIPAAAPSLARRVLGSLGPRPIFTTKRTKDTLRPPLR